MPSPSKIKAIVVDDQLTMRTLVRSCLQQIGLTDIREFPKAPEALAALKVEKGDTLILTEAPDGIRFTAYDPETSQQLTAMRSVMKKRRHALRELAK